MSKLLDALDNCPFCGGRPKIVSCAGFWVDCTECGAKSRFLDALKHSDAFAEDFKQIELTLLNLWNRRVIQSESSQTFLPRTDLKK